MGDLAHRITYLGTTSHRNSGRLFGIRQSDRRRHIYLVGATGVGKSHTLKMMAIQDIVAGSGLALFDPHGDLTRALVPLAKEKRPDDLIALDFTDPTLPWRFNPIAGISKANHALGVAGLVEVFNKHWADDWGPRLEHLLRNILFTLVESKNCTLADVPLLLADRDFRRGLVSRIENPVVRDFWFEEFDRYSPGFRAVVTAPIQNKLGALLTDPVSRRFLTEEGPQLDLHQLMNDEKVILINLDKGQIGEGPSGLLGSFLLSHIALAGIERSAQPEENRRDFAVYLDEFQTFTTQSIETALSQLRKFGVGFVLAHQHLSQIDPVIRDSVFGNVGTIIAFRVGAADAAHLAREFAPVFSAADLVNLPRFEIYIRLLINGETSRPFSAKTLRSIEDLPVKLE
jgi:hypothetical protein